MAKRRRTYAPRRFRRRRRRFIRRRRRNPKLYRPVKKPFPKVFKFRTRYVDFNRAMSSTTLPSRYVFSANGLYDPNLTGTGHQPIGFDQIMPMYDHYTVIASKIRVQATLADDTSSSTGLVGVLVKDSTSIPVPVITQLMENGNFKYRLFPTQGGNGAVCNFATGVSIKKWFPGSTMAREALAGTESANPTEGVYYHVIVDNTTTGSDTFKVYVTCTIDYIAILHEPKVLAQS